MSEFNNWNTPYKKARMVVRPPPGLKGKEIGMFFKNLRYTKEERLKKRECWLSFTMPPSVTATIKKNIQTILKTAQKENITLPPLKQNYMEGETSSIKTESQAYTNENITKIFDTIKNKYANTTNTDKCSSVKLEPDDKSSVKIDPSIVKSEPSETEDETKESDLLIESSVSKVEFDASTSSDSSESSKSESEVKEETDCKPSMVKEETDSKPSVVKEETDCKPSVVKEETDFKPSVVKEETDFKPSVVKEEIIDLTIANDFDNPIASTSTENSSSHEDSTDPPKTLKRQLELRPVSAFKYGYEDIITGSFDEKLEEQLAKGIDITKNKPENMHENLALFYEYKDMIQKYQYKNMLQFRNLLPTYRKSKDILEAIKNNQVLVISGETGCGKSTQVPQIILDDAICNKRGACVKILVTQPRRIAASSLATRVAKERGEQPGNSVGYAVRLERVIERPLGSIQYCTTGILLTELEVNQSLSNFSHIILDEVHERDCHIDLAMCMLKQVLKKRKDLKLILMSATIDSESLSEYFDKCLKIHIEGLAYPVKDVYLEQVLAMTGYRLPDTDTNSRNNRFLRNKMYNKQNRLKAMNERDHKKVQDYLEEVGGWIDSIKHYFDVNVIKTLKNPKIEEFNIDLIVELIKFICRGPPGAILVFVPGFNDISKLLCFLNDVHIRPPRFEIYSLHSKLPSFEQNRIFERPPNNVRKIVVATNIAETSITIDDIVYVIDCGRHKIKGLNVEQNVETLDIEYISKANMRQRRGRAGRCQPGICYHLVTSFRADKLQDRTLPELQRCNLLEAVLMVKQLRLGLAKVALQQVASPPAESSIEWAVKQLQRCGALDATETLTPLGWHMARLPVHPSAGKLVLLGALFGCLDRAASVAAVWGFKDPFILVIGKEGEIDACKRNLSFGEPSDHIAISEAIISFEQCPPRDRRDFCYANFLSYNTCKLLSDMKTQLGGNLRAMGFLPSGNVKASWENRNANNLSLFKALVAAALYPNIATARWIGLKSRRRNPHIRVIANTPEDGKVSIHPSSVMSGGVGTNKGPTHGPSCNKPGANWLVYWMKYQSVHLYIFEVTLIYSLPLLFFGDFILSRNTEIPGECILEVSSVKVRVTTQTANLLHDLKVLLDHVLASKVMSSSGHPVRNSKFEELVLNTVIELITAEDEQAEYVGEDLTDSDYSENDNDTASYSAF